LLDALTQIRSSTGADSSLFIFLSIVITMIIMGSALSLGLRLGVSGIAGIGVGVMSIFALAGWVPMNWMLMIVSLGIIVIYFSWKRGY